MNNRKFFPFYILDLNNNMTNILLQTTLAFCRHICVVYVILNLFGNRAVDEITPNPSVINQFEPMGSQWGVNGGSRVCAGQWGGHLELGRIARRGECKRRGNVAVCYRT